MARKPKFPKQPKQSSSAAVWQRYHERVKQVAAKRKQIEDRPKAIAKIKAQADALKAKA